MENNLTITSKNAVALLMNNDLSDLIKPLKQEILLLDSYVAGTAYAEDASIFDALKTGDELMLLREPDNKFDDKAILVLDREQRKLGYIPEKENTVFARLMDAGKYITAKVSDLDKLGDIVQISISIYLVDF